MKGFQKFDIVILDLNPPKGHAQAGVRPCVVVQSNLFNRFSSTIMVAPLTSNQKKIFPSEFWIQPSSKNGLENPSRFLGSQVMTLDKTYIVKKIGRLEEKYFSSIQGALAVSLDWDNQF